MRLPPIAATRCRRRVHLEHDPGADRSRMRPPDAGLRLRRDTLAGHQRAVLAALESRMTLVSDWRPQDWVDGAARPPAVRTARIATGPRIAVVDLLLRRPDGGYLPVLIRGHRTTDPGTGARLSGLDELSGLVDPAPSSRTGFAPGRASESKKARPHLGDVMALAHVHRMLQELGLAGADAWGGIVGFGGPSADAGWDDGATVVWHRLDRPGSSGLTPLAEYDARFADRLAVATAAATGAPALALPSKIAECRLCPWWSVCGPELEAAHDVSLLVAGGDVEVLRAAGAQRIDDVAAMEPARLATLPLTGIPAGEAQTRARAILAGVPLVRRRETVDVVRADVELDVDMESYLDDGAYLWGTYLSGAPLPGFAPGYRPFVTWEPLETAATATNFVAFWRYLTALREASADAGLTFAAYCYSHQAEERWLYGTAARFPDEPGMPTRAQIAAFCSSPQWVDLYTETKRLFIVPGSLRLKAVAPVCGFAWRDPEPGGENSMAWYRIATSAVAAPDATGEVDANRERILRYNEDDVLATWRLRQWMSERPDAMPTAADLAASYVAGR